MSAGDHLKNKEEQRHQPQLLSWVLWSLEVDRKGAHRNWKSWAIDDVVVEVENYLEMVKGIASEDDVIPAGGGEDTSL